MPYNEEEKLFPENRAQECILKVSTVHHGQFIYLVIPSQSSKSLEQDSVIID
jgi:hypothetical protein